MFVNNTLSFWLPTISYRVGGIMKLFHLDIPPKSPFGKGGLVVRCPSLR